MFFNDELWCNHEPERYFLSSGVRLKVKYGCGHFVATLEPNSSQWNRSEPVPSREDQSRPKKNDFETTFGAATRAPAAAIDRAPASCGRLRRPDDLADYLSASLRRRVRKENHSENATTTTKKKKKIKQNGPSVFLRRCPAYHLLNK